jgi:hypothetical protein
MSALARCSSVSRDFPHNIFMALESRRTAFSDFLTAGKLVSVSTVVTNED